MPGRRASTRPRAKRRSAWEVQHSATTSSGLTDVATARHLRGDDARGQGDKLLSHPWSASLLGSTGSTGSASQTRRQRPRTGPPFSLERHLKWASKTADNQVVTTGAGIARNFQATRFASAMTSVVERRTIGWAVLATSILLPVIVVAAYSNRWMGNDRGPAEMGL